MPLKKRGKMFKWKLPKDFRLDLKKADSPTSIPFYEERALGDIMNSGVFHGEKWSG
jgi:hypothetical protein